MKHSILKWGVISITILFLLLYTWIAVDRWFGTHDFLFQWPIAIQFHKPVQIVEREVVSPEVAEVPQDDNSIVLKVSHYNPDLGGVNCANFQDGECVSKMANGERWQDNIGLAIACPKELEFGTKIKIDDRVWECKDVGGKITKDGEIYWIDMLTPYPLYNYGEIVLGEIIE
ncbi:hypothetical protein LCGC14_2627750, partial [marine sediment metagenome]